MASLRVAAFVTLLCALACLSGASASDVHIDIDASNGYGPDNVTQHVGYITVNTTRHLFYWMFESRNSPSTDPFILWMTGGPGCSSLLALFYENGPYKINNDLSLSINPYSWNEVANVLWIDQPVGTGYSWADSGDIGVVTEQEMADNMYEFLQKFLTMYPQYQSNPFFVFGESYAGHYVPALSARIQVGNAGKQGLFINLQGSAVGNGLVDPLVQYGYYWQYARDHNLVNVNALGLMQGLAPICQGLIKGCAQNSTLGWLACINAYTMCNMAELMPVEFTGVNLYDVRGQCTIQPLCYNFSALPELLLQPAVVQALNVSGHSWTDCNRIVDMELVFAGDWMLNFASDIPLLLGSGHRILVYAGEYDFICNWYGNFNWMMNLDWSGQSEFQAAANVTWTVDSVAAGMSKSAQNMTFLKVFNAGHMVPMDQPANALDMVKRFLNNEPFN